MHRPGIPLYWERGVEETKGRYCSYSGIKAFFGGRRHHKHQAQQPPRTFLFPFPHLSSL
ncbi:hypothetical protein OIU79_023877 [Salix purpurea]|uniref:Uncharacterized protein n=1 Tax=Salix purpurea TaxID=77065 RepID=A0A9Q0W9L7_SALPP|nr:hypothetical protein OIU79_023877 [Salix purpurea]